MRCPTAQEQSNRSHGGPRRRRRGGGGAWGAALAWALLALAASPAGASTCAPPLTGPPKAQFCQHLEQVGNTRGNKGVAWASIHFVEYNPLCPASAYVRPPAPPPPPPQVCVDQNVFVHYGSSANPRSRRYAGIPAIKLSEHVRADLAGFGDQWDTETPYPQPQHRPATTSERNWRV